MDGYRAFDRLVIHLLTVIVVVIAAALVVWAVLGHMGVGVPLPLVLGATGAAAVWVIAEGRNEGREAPPPPTVPPVRRRPPTWEDAERMASLYRQGLITREQLENALRELAPPPLPPGPPAGRHHR